MTPKTQSVCPSYFWQCVIADVSLSVAAEDMIHNSYYQVQRHLSIHPSISNINTHEDNDDGLTAGHTQWTFWPSCVDFLAPWCVFTYFILVFTSQLTYSIGYAAEAPKHHMITF
jgi:hypothetical protein